MTPDIIARLEVLATQCCPGKCDRADRPEDQDDTCELHDLLIPLLAERKAMVEALEPFAKAGDHFKSYGHNAERGGAPAEDVYFGWPDHKVLIGDFYRARRAVAARLEEFAEILRICGTPRDIPEYRGLTYNGRDLREADLRAALARITELERRVAEMAKLGSELTGSLNFIMAFYEPGQTYLDTNAWKNAEASGRISLAKGKAIFWPDAKS